jgi:hypothetical protein
MELGRQADGFRGLLDPEPARCFATVDDDVTTAYRFARHLRRFGRFHPGRTGVPTLLDRR